MSLGSRRVLGFCKTGRDIISRNFGALTQRSWAADNSEILALAGVKSTSKKDAKISSDILIDSLFSRRLTLPHENNLSQLTSPYEISPGSTSVHSSILGTNERTGSIQAMNRNARRPKKANRGARPCSRAQRRKKKEAIGKRRR